MYLFSVGKKQNLSTKPQEYWSIGVLEQWNNKSRTALALTLTWI
jgi:hypothetical protein